MLVVDHRPVSQHLEILQLNTPVSQQSQHSPPCKTFGGVLKSAIIPNQAPLLQWSHLWFCQQHCPDHAQHRVHFLFFTGSLLCRHHHSLMVISKIGPEQWASFDSLSAVIDACPYTQPLSALSVELLGRPFQASTIHGFHGTSIQVAQ